MSVYPIGAVVKTDLLFQCFDQLCSKWLLSSLLSYPVFFWDSLLLTLNQPIPQLVQFITQCASLSYCLTSFSPAPALGALRSESTSCIDSSFSSLVPLYKHTLHRGQASQSGCPGSLHPASLRSILLFSLEQGDQGRGTSEGPGTDRTVCRGVQGQKGL